MPTDVVVVGLGVMGCAAALALARRGRRVVGIERFHIGHDLGSSHGCTRIIRLGYFEGASYVPLLQSAYRLWRELQAEAGEQLLHVTSILEIGPPNGKVIAGTLRASNEHNLPYVEMDASRAMQRFPAFRLPSDYVAVLQPDGGYLFAERATQAFASLAKNAGADLREGVKVLEIKPRADGVDIVTESGTVDAGAVIVTAGAWLKSLLPDLPVELRVTRQVAGWFEPLDPALFMPGRFPVFIMESRHGNHYGFPAQQLPPYAGLVKIAKHNHDREHVNPDGYQRNVVPEDELSIRAAIADYLPAADGRLVAAETCLYTQTADTNFLIDRLPGWPRIVVASPCSGHGFKFAPIIGERLADLVTTGMPPDDIVQFGLSRFTQK